VSALDELITEFAKLPGVGRKTAARLTYFLLKQPKEAPLRLASTIERVAELVGPCTVCGNLSEADPCEICEDPRRDASLLCVVEEASDISAIERTGEFRGHYHVLGGRLSPLDGVGPDDLRLDALAARVSNGSAVKEIIVATNHSMEGEATATLVRGVISDPDVRVSRIALGLPVGGDLEYADAVTIGHAISARREMTS